MHEYLNKVMLIGEIKGEIDYGKTKLGKKIYNFTLLVKEPSERSKDFNKETEACFYRVAVFKEQLIEEIEHENIQRNDKVYVEGRLSVRRRVINGAESFNAQIVLKDPFSNIIVLEEGENWPEV